MDEASIHADSISSEENIDNHYKYPDKILKIKDNSDTMTIKVYVWDTKNINLNPIFNCFVSKTNLKLKVETVIAIKMIKMWR